MILSWIEPTTFRFVAQCLNQMRQTCASLQIKPTKNNPTSAVLNTGKLTEIFMKHHVMFGEYLLQLYTKIKKKHWEIYRHVWLNVFLIIAFCVYLLDTTFSFHCTDTLYRNRINKQTRYQFEEKYITRNVENLMTLWILYMFPVLGVTVYVICVICDKNVYHLNLHL